MSIQLARVNIALNRKAGAPWPETFTPYQIAYFAAWRGDEPDPNLNARAAPLENALRVACHRGELEITATTKRIPKPGPRILSAGIGRETPPHPTVDETLFHIAAAPAARWLSAQDVPPGELLKAWFKSQGVGVAAVEVAPPAPAKKESAVERQDRRLQMCIDDGLVFLPKGIQRLPDGVGKVAEREGVERSTFSEDVKKALQRKYPETRPQLKAV